jgi:hypothetical protein
VILLLIATTFLPFVQSPEGALPALFVRGVTFEDFIGNIQFAPAQRDAWQANAARANPSSALVERLRNAGQDSHEQAVDKCPTARGGNEWIEVWSLFHRIRQVQRDNNTYTVTVEPVIAGFQMIYIRRINPSVLLRFVTVDGEELERWDESAPPNRVKNVLPPGTAVQPLIIRK